MTSSQPWQTVILPDAVTRVASLLSPEEKQYLTWLTAEQYVGWGAIVELGAWLGSSSVALAEGLRRGGSAARVRSFDRFEWEPVVPGRKDLDLEAGADFLPLYMKGIGEYAPWIDVEKQDLMGYAWEGGPIEILFVDSAKTWELTSSILRGFGPALVPGRSRVVLQDFRYHWAHCLPLIFDSRPDVWKQVEDVATSTTVTFTPLKPLFGPCGIHETYSEEAFPFAAAAELLQRRLGREEHYNRSLESTLYRKCLIDGPIDTALALRERVVSGGVAPEELSVIEDVEHILHPRGWRAFELGDYATARDCASRCLVRARPRSIYALTLLGFSLLRLGDRTRSREAAEEVLSRAPGFASAKLLVAEICLAEERHAEAEHECLEVLRAKPSDETTIEWALNILTQCWDGREVRRSHADILATLVESLGGSAAFAAHFERERQL